MPAAGMYPKTGQPLPSGGVLDRPDVIRALNLAARELRHEPREKGKDDYPVNHGKPWQAEEEAQVLAKFDQGMGLKDIALRHGRSTGAFRKRLIHAGGLEE